MAPVVIVKTDGLFAALVLSSHEFRAYIPLGWGSGFIGLGLTWFLHGSDIGTDPDVFIGWENETKMPFFYMNYAALYVSSRLCMCLS